MTEIRIGSYNIGESHPPFIIAELSGNHNGSLDTAMALVDAAANSGASALKLQTYTADTMTLDLSEGDFFIKDEDNPWHGTSLHQLYERAHTPWSWHEPLFCRAKELGMVPFSSVFDETSVDFLEGLGCQAYKIASFELTDLPLIETVAKTGKPLIMSTGMASEAEILEAVDVAKRNGATDIVLLKCTSSYPASPEDSNLLTIPHLRNLTGCIVGLSDHTLGVGCSAASVLLGGAVIERHLTLDRSAGGVDAAFSLEPVEFSQLVQEAYSVWQGRGSVVYGGAKSEQMSKQYRRSIYITENLIAGEVLTKLNTRIIRPGFGLAPKFYNQIVGSRLKTDAKIGTPLSWELIS